MSYLKYTIYAVFLLSLQSLPDWVKANEPKALDAIWDSPLLTEDIYVQLNSKCAYNPVAKVLLNILFIPSIMPSPDSHLSWQQYQGQVIGNIQLNRLGVFAPIGKDQTLSNFWKKVGNLLFPPTRAWVIQQHLTLSVGDTIVLENLQQSIQNLDSLAYLKQAQLCITPKPSPDTVDMLVTTQDNFPIQAALNLESLVLQVCHQNIGGLGHAFTNYFSYDQKLGYGFKYSIPNIFYLSSIGEAYYLNTHKKQIKRITAFQKFTQLTHQAGAVEVSYKRLLAFRLLDKPAIAAVMPYSFYYQNLWLGKILNPQAPHSNKVFYLTGRIAHKAFQERPFVNSNTNRFFHDHTFVVGSWGFANQYLHTAHFVNEVGQAEAVPGGSKLNLLGGYQVGEFLNRPYIGLDMAHSLIGPSLGYLVAAMNLGGFLRKQAIEQGIIKLTASYFTPVLQLHNARMRQFMRLNYLAGFNMFTGEYISSHTKRVPKAWTDPFPVGTKRLNVHLETVWWPFRRLAGCQVAILSFLDAVTLHDAHHIALQSSFCEALGMGLRIGHERFALGTIQVNIGYRPIVGGMEFTITKPIEWQPNFFTISEPGTIALKAY